MQIIGYRVGFVLICRTFVYFRFQRILIVEEHHLLFCRSIVVRFGVVCKVKPNVSKYMDITKSESKSNIVCN